MNKHQPSWLKKSVCVCVGVVNTQVLVDTEELGQDEQDAPLAWFGAQPPPRRAPLEDDPTLPRSFLRTPSSVPTAGESDDDGDNQDMFGGGGGGGSGDARGGVIADGGTASSRSGGGGSCVGPEADDDVAVGGDGIAAAGVGAAHVLTGPERLEDGAWEEASSACPGMRYFTAAFGLCLQ